MSTSSGTWTISTTVGTNWMAVRTFPSMPGMRSAEHATTATIDQNSGASGGEGRRRPKTKPVRATS